MIDDPLNRIKVKRGTYLPQAKLNENDVKVIRDAVIERDRLRREANQLSNKNLADKFDVHVRTIEKVVAGETWLYS